MKRVVGFMLVCAMLLTSALATSESALTLDGKPATVAQIAQATGLDYEGEIKPLFETEAVYLWERGILLGSNGSFHLDQALDRASGVTLIVRMLGAEAEAKANTYEHPFTDVPDWAEPYVGYAYEHGITKGISETLFGYSAPLSGQQYMTLVLRAMQFEEHTDFTYATALDAAKEQALLSDAMYALFSRTNLCLRDHIAQVTYQALKTPCKGEEALLEEKLNLTVVNSGTAPRATMSTRTREISLNFGRLEAAGGGLGSTDLTYDDQRGVVHARIYLVLETGDTGGDIALTFSINGVEKTHVVPAQRQSTYQVILDLECAPVYGSTAVSNQVSVTAENGAKASVSVACRGEFQVESAQFS